jgi:hypothetical protein
MDYNNLYHSNNHSDDIAMVKKQKFPTLMPGRYAKAEFYELNSNYQLLNIAHIV